MDNLPTICFFAVPFAIGFVWIVYKIINLADFIVDYKKTVEFSPWYKGKSRDGIDVYLNINLTFGLPLFYKVPKELGTEVSQLLISIAKKDTETHDVKDLKRFDVLNDEDWESVEKLALKYNLEIYNIEYKFYHA